jgi:hypothetical protein
MFPKPLRGTALMERKAKRQAQKAAELKVMKAAKTRDGGRCRWPGCKHKDMPVDACHRFHRGMGGDKNLERTKRELIWTACRIHHGQYDAGLIDIQPQGPQGTDGPCDFFTRTESGRMELVASEKRWVVSSAR